MVDSYGKWVGKSTIHRMGRRLYFPTDRLIRKLIRSSKSRRSESTWVYLHAGYKTSQESCKKSHHTSDTSRLEKFTESWTPCWANQSSRVVWICERVVHIQHSANEKLASSLSRLIVKCTDNEGSVCPRSWRMQRKQMYEVLWPKTDFCNRTLKCLLLRKCPKQSIYAMTMTQLNAK